MKAESAAAPAQSGLRWALITAGLLALVALIGLADYWTGTEIAFSIFFLVPIALSAWLQGRRTSIALAIASAAAWLLADRSGGFPYSHPTIPYWNAGMGLGFFLIIALTLSARRRAEQRILELMNVKSEFASMVSHELRTPLTCIKEGIAMVLDGDPGAVGEVQREHLRTAKRNVDRLARLVNDVLTLQKLEAGRVELECSPCDLGRLVQQAVSDFGLLAERRGLELVCAPPAPLPQVSCDAERIRLALDNLIGNALKFTTSGRIRVHTERVPEGVRVLVHDSGPGIREQDLGKLFRSFSQLAGHAHQPAGTGLGLAIVRQIVELHGGRVGVESRLGSGSTFHFTLPVEPVHGTSPHRGQRASAGAEPGEAQRAAR